ncbi:uncharacterized protein KGF55_000743 [Candida pseudojiufengensis]|uniref:uncharacterized protein n=1 Tax=Candida pseudojiufengensis TaxID=497109 RepID=UPI0022241C27|nr:uncharacterized protein KGF55_000743 [Candida pseudojiufengensis]KAI5966434.1 hypothetical protein KGF55_000743 [Candida pseudojiufengensis]
MTKTISEILELRGNGGNEEQSTTQSKITLNSYLIPAGFNNGLSKHNSSKIDSDSSSASNDQQENKSQVKFCMRLIYRIFEEKPLQYDIRYLSQLTQAYCENKGNSVFIRDFLFDKFHSFLKDFTDKLKKDAFISSLDSNDENTKLKYNEEEVIKACEIALEYWNRYEKILTKLQILFKVSTKFEKKIKGSPYEMGINYFNKFCFEVKERYQLLGNDHEESDDISYFWELDFMDRLFVLMSEIYLKDKYFEKSNIQTDIFSLYEKFLTFIKKRHRYSVDFMSSFEIARHAIIKYLKNGKYENLNGRCDFKGPTKTKTILNVIDEEVKFAKKFHEDNIDAREYDIFMSTPFLSHNFENNKQMAMDVCDLTRSLVDLQKVFEYLENYDDDSDDVEAVKKFGPIRDIAVQKLQKHFESQIETIIIEHLNSKDNPIPDPSLLIPLVQQIKSSFVQIHNANSAMVNPYSTRKENTIDGQNILQSVINKVGDQNTITKQLAKLVDMYFKCKLQQDCHVSIIQEVLGIIVNGLSEDTEVDFVSLYQKDLFKRLLLNKQVNLIEELEIAEYINSIIRHKNSSIIELIKDVSRNKITTINLGAVGKSIEFKSLILDSSVWANMLPDESFKSVILPSEFQNVLNFNRSPKGNGLSDWTHYKLHRLTILGQFSDNREIPINCNMLQAIIILSFNDNDKMSFDQLQEKTKLESNLLKSILNTFSTSANRILLYKKDQITYNRKFKSKSDVVNLPMIKDNIKAVDGSSRETSIATEVVGNDNEN